MLQMVVRAIQRGVLPSNRADLYRNFAVWVLMRDDRALQVHWDVKYVMLTVIALQLRMSGRTTAAEASVLAWISNLGDRDNGALPAEARLEAVLDSRFVTRNPQGSIEFWHESFLEYFAAVGLRSLYLRDRAGIAACSGRPEWFEAICMLAGLLPPDDALVELIAPRNLVLAARCATAAGPVRDSSERAILETAAARLGGSIRDREDVVTALAEVATPRAIGALRAAMDAQLSEMSVSRPLRRCSRPVTATLALLKCDLPHQRVTQVLEALRSGDASPEELDSPILGAVHSDLLRGEPDAATWHALGHTGVSRTLLPVLLDRLKSELARLTPADERWLAAFKCAAVCGLKVDVQAVVFSKLRDAASVSSGPAIAAIMLAAEEYPSHAEVSQMMRRTMRQCLSGGLFGLCATIIERWKLQDELAPEEVSAHFAKMVQDRRIGGFQAFARLYPGAADGLVGTLLDELLRQGNLDKVRGHIDLFRPYCTPRADRLRDLAIQDYLEHRKPALLMRSIRAFGLQPHFHNAGIIIHRGKMDPLLAMHPNLVRRFRIADLCDYDRWYSYAPSAVQGWPLRRQPRVGDIVTCEADEPEHGGNLIATRVSLMIGVDGTRPGGARNGMNAAS